MDDSKQEISTRGEEFKNLKPVELGFVDNVLSPEELLSYRFPSKVGGRPAWLALKKLPTVDVLSCPTCGKTRVLLLQIYCPYDEQIYSFHRTLFLFVCRESACSMENSSQNFLVLRSQLPKVNEFYCNKPPMVKNPSGNWVEISDENFPKPVASDYNKVCFVCGSMGPKICGKCRKASYCSKEHQTLHWKAGHKIECSKGLENDSLLYVNFDNHFLPELSLITETEDLEDGDSESEDEAESETKAPNVDGQSDKILSLSELESMALAETEEDKIFQNFKRRISKDPDQILRYQRGGNPLWVSGNNVPTSEDIPVCSCGGKRQFEFQVLPQLLNNLGLDRLEKSLDWGTLVIYTCAQNCDIQDRYVQEFVWKQDFTMEDKKK